MSNLAFAAASNLAQQLYARGIGCLELLDHYLQRAATYNPQLNAIVAWQVDVARARASAADAALAKGEVWGPLHGLPMTVKEAFDVAGLPTTFGNPAYADNIAVHNAIVVERLLSAGAVIFGKTNVPFMLIDSQTFNDIYGTTNNPWDLTRAPGGSSGGAAAALAAGLVALEAGSDIGGSLRNPGHYTGIYGHKPTYGIIPAQGQAPPGLLAPPDLEVVGPMARYAEDLDLALTALVGPGDLDADAWHIALPPPRATRLDRFRVAVWRNSHLSAIANEVLERFDVAVDAVRRRGAAVNETARPRLDPEHSHRTYMALLRAATSSRMSEEFFAAQKAIASSVSADDRSHRAATARGATLYQREWLRLHDERVRLRRAWHEFFREFDVVLAPIAATPAFPHDHNPDRDQRKMWVDGKAVAYTDQLFWAGLATVAYLPATAAPIGLAGGLPVGLQIIGPAGGDRTTIEFARLLADEIGGFVRPPGYTDQAAESRLRGEATSPSYAAAPRRKPLG
jgi:amidase